MADVGHRRLLAAPVLLCLAALYAGPATALSISGLKNSLVSFLLERVSVPGRFEVRAERIDNPADGSTALEGVRVADSDGVWLSARRVAFSWSPARLLKGQVQINELTIEGARLVRLPVTAGAEPPPVGPAEAASGWPRSPIAVRVVRLVIADMRISDAVLPQAIAFDATGSMSDEGDTQSLTIALERTDDISGAIDLSYLKRFDDSTLQLSLDARESAGGLVASAAGLPPDAPTTLRVNGRGRAEDWNGDVDLAITDVIAARGGLVARWADRIGAKLDLEVRSGPKLSEAPRLAIGEQAALSVALAEDDGGIVRIERATLRSGALGAVASGSFDRGRRDLDVAVELSVDGAAARRLRPLLDPLRFDRAGLRLVVRGPVDAPLVRGNGLLERPAALAFGAQRATVAFEAPTVPGAAITLDLRAEQPFGPDERYRALLGESIALALLAERGDGRVTIERAKLSGRKLDAEASGEVLLSAEPRLALRYRIDAPDLAPFAALAGLDGAGALGAEGTLRGTPGDLDTRGRIRVDDAVVRGQRLGRIALEHRTHVAKQVTGSVDLDLDSPDFGPGHAKAAFALAADGIDIRELDVDLMEIAARGDLRLPAAGGAPGGRLALDIRSLEPAGLVSGIALGGRGQALVEFAPSDDGRVAAHARIEHLRVGEAALAEATLTLGARGLGSDSPPRLDLMLAGSGLEAPGAAADSLDLHAAGPVDALAVTARAAGRFDERPFDARTHLVAALDGPRRTARMDRLDLAYAGESASLAAPALLTFTDGAYEVADLDLRLPDDGRIAGRAVLDAVSARAQLTLDSVPLRLAQTLADIPLAEGRLSGTVVADTGRERPRLDARLDLAGVRVGTAPPEVPPLSARLTTRWDGADLTVDGEMHGGFDPPIVAAARLPLSPSTGPVPELSTSAPFEASLAWRGEVESLVALMPLPDHLLTGDLVVDLQAHGSIEAPALAGELTLERGRYENLLTGTLLRDLRLRSDFTDSRRVNLELTASDGERGELRVAGYAEVGAAAPVLAFTATARDMLMVRLDAATVRGSADLTLNTVDRGLAVAGTVGVNRAEVRLLNPLPPTIVDLGPVEVLGAPRGRDVAPEKDGGGLVLLDIAVSTPGPVFVRGRGLDSEWGGSLSVSGTAAEPRVNGRIESRRGALDFVGRQFKLVRGRFVFSGGDRIDPNLDIRLERATEDVTGRIEVTGTATHPKLEFSSSPPLPRDEVLPRVLFGRSSQSLSGPEALQLAAGVAALVRGEVSQLERGRRALGLDVLRIESEGDGDARMPSLSVGRYARENVYVGAKQSFDGKSSTIVVEVQLRRHLAVDADVGQDGHGSFGLTWKRDF